MECERSSYQGRLGFKCPWFLLYLAPNVTTEIGMTFPCPPPSFSTHSQKQYGHLKSCQMTVIFDTWLDWESNLLKKEPILQDDCQWWDLRKGLWKVLKRVSLGLNTYCPATAQTGRLPALSVLYFLAWRWHQPQHSFICKPATVVLQPGMEHPRNEAERGWSASRHPCSISGSCPTGAWQSGGRASLTLM